MDIKIDVKGLAELRARLDGFSDRRFAAAIATALTRTGVQVKDAIRAELPRVFDRPTPYTMNAVFTKGATAERLTAKTWLKDDRATSRAGTPAVNYILPNIEGGERRTKRFEVALRKGGALPEGYLVVPGAGAALDAYGNISTGQITQILSQLRIQLVGGSSRNMSLDARKQIAAQRRAGGRYFVIPPGSRVQPGIYQREFTGRGITPVLIFVRHANYRPRWNFKAFAERAAAPLLQANVERSVQEHIARLAAKNAA